MLDFNNSAALVGHVSVCESLRAVRREATKPHLVREHQQHILRWLFLSFLATRVKASEWHGP